MKIPVIELQEIDLPYDNFIDKRLASVTVEFVLVFKKDGRHYGISYEERTNEQGEISQPWEGCSEVECREVRLVYDDEDGIQTWEEVDEES